MVTLKDILYGIKIRKKTSILIVIQLLFTLYVVHSILGFYLTGTIISSKKKWAIEDIGNTYIVKTEPFEVIMNDEIYMKSIEDLKQSKLGTVGIYNGLSLDFENIFEQGVVVTGLGIDKNYYDMLNRDLIIGNGFTNEEFKENKDKPMPIILGYNYKKKCNINDVIEEKNSGKKYIVVGFLKPNKALPESNYSMTTYVNSKNSFIIPIQDEKYNSTIHAIIKFNDNNSVNVKIDNLAFANMQSFIKNQIDSFAKHNRQWLPFAIVSMAIALVGIITSNILSILLRKREFGIRLVLGESINKILFKNTMENILLSIIAVVSAPLLKYIINKNFIQFRKVSALDGLVNIKFDVEFFMVIIGGVVIITLISSIISFQIMKRVQPKDLIGGIE